jgi:hypothetical protein
MLTAEKFFTAFDRAGMLQTVTWLPSNTLGPAFTGPARFKASDTDLLGGEQLSTDLSMTYPASQFGGLVAGEVVTIGGVEYRLRRDPESQLDGSVMMARLERLEP